MLIFLHWGLYCKLKNKIHVFAILLQFCIYSSGFKSEFGVSKQSLWLRIWSRQPIGFLVRHTQPDRMFSQSSISECINILGGVSLSCRLSSIRYPNFGVVVLWKCGKCLQTIQHNSKIWICNVPGPVSWFLWITTPRIQ